MDALAKALGHFVTRDILFIAAGCLLLFAVSLLGGVAVPADTSTLSWIVVFAWAYAVGYASQSLAALLGLVKVRAVPDPGKFMRFIYRRFEGNEWKEPDDKETRFMSVDLKAAAVADEGKVLEYRRVIFLKSIGSSIGSACFFSAPMLVAVSLRSNDLRHWLLLASVCVLAVVLLVMSRLHAMQQRLYAAELNALSKQYAPNDG